MRTRRITALRSAPTPLSASAARATWCCNSRFRHPETWDRYREAIRRRDLQAVQRADLWAVPRALPRRRDVGENDRAHRVGFRLIFDEIAALVLRAIHTIQQATAGQL
jgi:hypothetical protein